MAVTLDTLELTKEELELAREAVRRLAYAKWLDAGSPQGHDVDFWAQAEQEWIARNYVPARTLDGTRPPLDSLTSDAVDRNDYAHASGAEVG